MNLCHIQCSALCMALVLTRRVVGLVFLMVCRGFLEIAGAQNAQAQQVYIKRTFFDYAG